MSTENTRLLQTVDIHSTSHCAFNEYYEVKIYNYLDNAVFDL